MFCDTVVSVAELLTSIVGDSPCTSTLSVRDATFIVKSTVAVFARPTVTYSVCAAKLVPSSAFSAYAPGCTATNRNCPFSSVVVVCAPRGPVSVTVAPGRIAPGSSLTVRSTVPTDVCACAPVASSEAARTSAERRAIHFILVILLLLRRRVDLVVRRRVDRIPGPDGHHGEHH